MKTYNTFDDFFKFIINGKWFIPNKIFSTILGSCKENKEITITDIKNDSYYNTWNNSIVNNNIESIKVSLFNDETTIDKISVKNKIQKGEDIICYKSKKQLYIYLRDSKLNDEDLEQKMNILVCKCLHGKFETVDRVCIEYYEDRLFSFSDFVNQILNLCNFLNKKVKKIKVEDRNNVFEDYKNKIINEPISTKDKTLAFSQLTYRFVAKSNFSGIYKNCGIDKLFSSIISINNIVSMLKGAFNGNNTKNEFDLSKFDMSSISNIVNVFSSIKTDTKNTNNANANVNLDLSNFMSNFTTKDLNNGK